MECRECHTSFSYPGKIIRVTPYGMCELCGKPVLLSKNEIDGEVTIMNEQSEERGKRRQRIIELEEEIKASNVLLEESYRVLDEIPACPAHGNKCVPNAVEWVRRVRTLGELIFK